MAAVLSAKCVQNRRRSPALSTYVFPALVSAIVLLSALAHAHDDVSPTPVPDASLVRELVASGALRYVFKVHCEADHVVWVHFSIDGDVPAGMRPFEFRVAGYLSSFLNTRDEADPDSATSSFESLAFSYLLTLGAGMPLPYLSVPVDTKTAPRRWHAIEVAATIANGTDEELVTLSTPPFSTFAIVPGEAESGTLDSISQSEFMGEPAELGWAADDVVVTSFMGYTFRDVAPFFVSLRNKFDGDVVALTSAMEQERGSELMGLLQALNVRVVLFSEKECRAHYEQYHIHNYRWDLYYWVASMRPNGFMLVADVRDTFFQLPPFQWIEGHGVGRDEAAVHAHCESGNYNIGIGMYDSVWVRNGFGQDVFDAVRASPIINSGVMLGTSAGIALLAEAVVATLRTPRATVGTTIDQGVVNYLVHTGRINATVFPRGQGSVMQLGAVASAVFERVAISRERSGITERPPEWLEDFYVPGGDVLNVDGRPVPIVHEWDRHKNLLKPLVHRLVQQSSPYKLSDFGIDGEAWGKFWS